MRTLRTGLVAIGASIVGVVTLRAIRQRRKTPRDEAKAAAEDAFEETRAAAEHASAAAKHSRVAGQKAIEYARDEIDSVSDAADSDDGPPLAGRGRRLRKAGKGWIRR